MRKRLATIPQSEGETKMDIQSGVSRLEVAGDSLQENPHLRKHRFYHVGEALEAKMADGEHWEGQGAKEPVAHRAEDPSPEQTVSSDDEPLCAEGHWFPHRGTVHTREPDCRPGLDS